MAMIPDYSATISRGQAIANGVREALNIIANTSTEAVKLYKQNRSLEYAYKGVRGNLVENMAKYGLNDKQVEAMAQRMKFRDGENIDAYEKRISPTLLNLKLWENYTKDPEYEVDLPDPFMDTNSFLSILDMEAKRKTEKAMRAQESAVAEEVQNAVFGSDPAKTKESATRLMAGRLPKTAIPEKQLEQYPAYRSLPSEKDTEEQALQQLKQEEVKAGIGLKGAQTEAAQALTKQRTTAIKLKELAQSQNKGAELNKLKDLSSVARLEIAAREKLKDIPKDDGEGGISEEWIDMKELTDLLKAKRNELSGKKEPERTEFRQEAEVQADKISEMLKPLTSAGPDEQLSFVAKSIEEFANARGVSINIDRIKAALKQNNSAADILERVYMAVQNQKGSPMQP